MSPTDPHDLGYSTTPSNSATPGQSPHSPKGSRANKGRIVIIVCVVVALAIAGVVAWGLLRPDEAAAPATSNPPTSDVPSDQPTAESTPKSVDPAIMPFDLTADLETPGWVWLMGMWSGVAVFDLDYSAGTGNPEWDSKAVMRAVEVSTGKILWTYDTYKDVGSRPLADGGPGFGIDSDGEDLVASFIIKDQASNDAGDARIMVMSLRTGDVHSSALFDAEPVANANGGTSSWGWSVIAFQDNTVVVEGVRYNDTLVKQETRAYAKNDLNTPLWTISGTGPGVGQFASGYPSDPYLPGGYVLAASDEYVGIKDGKPSGMKLAANTDPNHVVYHVEDGTILVDTYKVDSTDPNSVFVGPLLSTSALDPSTHVPTWTYQLPKELGDKSPLGTCAAHGDLVYFEWDSDTGPIDIYALNMASGKQEWNTTVSTKRPGSGCTELNLAGKPVIAIAPSLVETPYEDTVLVDAATGDTITTVAAEVVFATQEDGQVAMFVQADDTLSIVSADSLNAPPLWTREIELVLPANAINPWIPTVTPDGSIYVAREDGQYEFILM